MTCTSPPAITDRDLLAYLDGQAGDEVQQHLARCAHCREHANALARLERHLATELNRVLCPASEELGEYYLQLLPVHRAEEIRQHLACCPLCTREIAELQGYLAELVPNAEAAPGEAGRSRVRVWIARLSEGMTGAGPGPQPIPALAGLRGEDEGPRVYKVADIQLSIEVQTDPQQPGSRSLLGLLLGEGEKGFRAHLWQSGRHIVSVPVDDAGNFVIPGLEPGTYELVLDGRDMEVHVQDLAVS